MKKSIQAAHAFYGERRDNRKKELTHSRQMISLPPAKRIRRLSLSPRPAALPPKLTITSESRGGSPGDPPRVYVFIPV